MSMVSHMSSLGVSMDTMASTGFQSASVSLMVSHVPPTKNVISESSSSMIVGGKMMPW